METDYFLSNVQETNCTQMTYEECLLGPRRDPLSIVIPMTIFYGLIFVTGLIGNFCTCTVIARNSHMHNATNYYLFSLAVSDIFLLVLGLPQEFHLLWMKYPYVFGEVVCVLRGTASEASTNASILTITAFTIERYVAICHPLKARKLSHLPRVIKIIVWIWILSFLCALPVTLQFGIEFLKDEEGKQIPETAMCTLVSPVPYAFEISTVIMFILPMAVITVLYILIILQLKRSNPVHEEGGQNGNDEEDYRNRTRKSAVKLLIAVVVCFFVCWSPFHVQRIYAIYVTVGTSFQERIYVILTNVSGIMYYLSATMNPILYNLFSEKFKQAFKETFCAYGIST